jgi:hypothetical protein
VWVNTQDVTDPRNLVKAEGYFVIYSVKDVAFFVNIIEN